MITIFRHGEANLFGKSDKTRELTESGKLFIKQQAKFLKEQNISYDVCFCSPYFRTLQTLDILKDTIEVKEVQILSDLEPHGSEFITEFIELQAQSKYHNILIVSHMPLVTDLVSELCGAVKYIQFNPGYLCILDKKQNETKYKVIYTTDLNKN